MKTGTVYFVSNLPANAEIVDARVRHVISSSDVVLYDDSVPAEILSLTRASARHHNIGAAGSPAAMTPKEIRARLVTYATEGFSVAYLESDLSADAAVSTTTADVLRACGIEFEILSGVGDAEIQSQTAAARA